MIQYADIINATYFYFFSNTEYSLFFDSTLAILYCLFHQHHRSINMHIRQQGSNLVLVRTTYDPARKRGVQTTIGRIPAHTTTDSVPAEVRGQLTLEEAGQLDDYLRARAEGVRLESQKRSVSTIAGLLRSTTDAVNAGVKPTNSDSIWEAMSELQKSLKRAGFPKPQRGDKEA